MNNKCLKNKVLPHEKDDCDCCYDNDIKVTVCPSNNKCEYSMCKKCIKNLEKKTKSNKCPACREEIINIKNIILEEEYISDSEPETTENNVGITWTLNMGCCKCIFQEPYPQNNFYRLNACYSCSQQVCCCVYNHYNYRYGYKKALLYAILIHFAAIIAGRICYAVFYDEQLLFQFWDIWYIFLGKSAIGLAFGFCAIMVAAFVLACVYNHCCDGHDDDC